MANDTAARGCRAILGCLTVIGMAFLLTIGCIAIVGGSASSLPQAESVSPVGEKYSPVASPPVVGQEDEQPRVVDDKLAKQCSRLVEQLKELEKKLANARENNWHQVDSDDPKAAERWGAFAREFNDNLDSFKKSVSSNVDDREVRVLFSDADTSLYAMFLGLAFRRESDYRKGEARYQETLKKLEQFTKASKSDHWRVWTSGKYTVRAKFLGKIGSTVKLEKEDGTVIEVPTDRLSIADNAWIAGRERAK